MLPSVTFLPPPSAAPATRRSTSIIRSTNDPYGSPLGAGVLDAVALPVHRRRNRRLDDERAGDAGDPVVDLRAIDEDFLFWRLVVGDALERDVRHDAADVFALVVLLALVDEAAGRSVRRRPSARTRETSP